MIAPVAAEKDPGLQAVHAEAPVARERNQGAGDCVCVCVCARVCVIL